MTNEPKRRRHMALMVLPHLRVQNANAVSSPMTWGFPAITAFTGMMVALERKLTAEAGVSFMRVGVVCHDHEAQITPTGRTRSFRLTRNPVLADGSSAAIVEEGRIHLDVTLVFEVRLSDDHLDDAVREACAQRIADTAAGMRLAGGSILPATPVVATTKLKPWMELLQPREEVKERQAQFRRLARRCLPGFTLVSRHTLLEERLAELKAEQPGATALDALLDLSCLTIRAEAPAACAVGASSTEWIHEARSGWYVPIPVGYAALSEIYPPGTVRGARDQHTPFRFAETLWSVGQWISPHRLNDVEDLLWHSGAPTAQGLYCCTNRYQPAPPAGFDLDEEVFDD